VTTYYYTRKGSPDKIPARSQALAESYAEMYGGEVYVNPLTEPILFSSEEVQMKYIDLLKTLLAFGPKLAEVWPLVMQLVELVKQIAAKVIPAPAAASGGLELVTPTEEEAAAESQIAQCLTAGGTSQAVIDFSGLRGIFTLLKLAPQLAGFLTGALDLLKKLFPAG
jgi:hypothetical protein